MVRYWRDCRERRTYETPCLSGGRLHSYGITTIHKRTYCFRISGHSALSAQFTIYESRHSKAIMKHIIFLLLLVITSNPILPPNPLTCEEHLLLIEKAERLKQSIPGLPLPHEPPMIKTKEG